VVGNANLSSAVDAASISVALELIFAAIATDVETTGIGYKGVPVSVSHNLQTFRCLCEQFARKWLLYLNEPLCLRAMKVLLNLS
jgi:hypothetical protein